MKMFQELDSAPVSSGKKGRRQKPYLWWPPASASLRPVQVMAKQHIFSCTHTVISF
jgi:hypothetical protein